MPLYIVPKGDVQATPTKRLNDQTLRDLAHRAANEEVGAANFETKLSYKFADDRITEVDLTFMLTIEMPVWPNYGHRPEAERREWDRFYRALLEHEQGHIAIFRREARGTFTVLLAEQRSTIEDKLVQETERIQRLSDAYDRDTDHGRKQKTSNGTTIIVAR